ncbi:MAG: hypothetical protein H7257_13655 [Taibaiella sp.]|nr:hypothetical protein [Taibaiella sp.]
MDLPYSYHEAEELCGRFKYLCGTSFGERALIENIVIAPFDSNYKQRFFVYYLLFDNDAVAALEEYKGSLYDVMVIARCDDGELAYESLHSWVQRNKMLTDFPKDIRQQLSLSQLYL